MTQHHMAVMMFNKKMTLVLLTHVRFLTLTQICTIRDRSLFIALGGGVAEDFGGDHLIFRRTKEGISRN